MKNIYFYNTRIGRIAIADNGRAIVRLAFVKGDGTGTAVRQVKDDTGSWQAENGETFAVRETPLIKEATGQLNEYLEGNRRVFDIPLDLDGTPFQKAVWDALLEIPYGETRSYGEIAERIGNPKAARAVGMANNRNPAAIFVPCHRVIGADGRLVGYASGVDIKEKLLDLEQMHITGRASG